MVPINIATNKISQPISDAFLREKYLIPEGEAFPEALLLARKFEKASQVMTRLEQTEKEISNGLTRLEEGSEVLFTQIDSLIRSEERTKTALQKLAKSSSELRGMTSNIANFAGRFFNPIRNGLQSGFCFLTGHREPAAVLPRENQLAIEYTIDPTNPSSIDEKKKRVNLLKFCMIVGGSYLLYAREQRIWCCLSAKE